MKHWGWGYEDQTLPREQAEPLLAMARERLGFGPAPLEDPVPLDAVELPAPRLEPPPALAAICSGDPHDRVTHAYGKSYRDIVRAFRGRFDHPPDVVARPGDEAELTAVLDWCAGAGAAASPFGGGTRVCAGVEPDVGEGYAGTVSIDMGRLDRVLEVDRTSRAARIQAGALGPALEEQLKEHELTLRHFPQSFEYSTLGGWIATRAGGHFATLYTHIDDFVESVRAITPRGVWESRRLPGSGAGPSPDRMLIGSEGILGVITEAWMRVQDRPRHKAAAGVEFDSFEAGAEAVRELSQSGLYPSNCRLLDPGEAALTGAASDGRALLNLGFESAHHPVDEWMRLAREACEAHGGTVEEKGEGTGTWRSAFLQMPYLRDTLIAGGLMSDTFETAITWDRLHEFVAAVRGRVESALAEIYGAGSVTCRFTHVYPDGAAPYFTMLAPARPGSELEQWVEAKAAASDAVIDGGGTITHHHAVGRDHRPWYERQRPEPFAEALRGAKAALDPGWMLNPGALIAR